MPAPSRQLATVRAAAGRADVGRKRSHNEDSVLARLDLGVFMVADGAGGHAAGEVASRLAVTGIAHFFEATQAELTSRPDYDEFGLSIGERWLARAVKRANYDIIEAGASSTDCKGMGTTIVAASISPRSGVLHIAHVGDSRCYRLRMGHLERLTQDHSLIVEVIEQRPDIDDDSLAKLPTNVITRALGVDPNVRVSLRSQTIDPTDRYLLCSDGLWNSLSDDEIAEWLAEGVTPEQTVETLIEHANIGGGEDNIGVLVLFCGAQNSSSEVQADAPRLTRKSARPSRDESTPEIMVIGIEEVDLDLQARARLPEISNRAAVARAAPYAEAPPLPVLPLAAEPNPDERICRVCKSPFNTDFCPFCGTRGDPRP